jgi:3-oxoacyl-(acyl-carrier-protein) synthase
VEGRVHIAGAGVISAIGNSYQHCFESLQDGKAGIAPLSNIASIYKNILPVGEVTLTNEQLASVLHLEKPITRTAMLGIHAANEALKNSRIRNLQKWRTGLISATTVGGMDRSELFFPQFLEDSVSGNLEDIVNHGCGSTTERIADALQISNFISTVNTACSSSVNSIALAARLIHHGQLDVVVAGGADSLTRFTINGFKSLMILDDEQCRPFDGTRKGLNLGEGAGFVVLVSDRVLRQEKLSSLAVVAGFANTNDAFHQTASSPEGRGSYHAMEKALTMSSLKKGAIGYINLHGTGTLNNDLSEGTAISRLFGENYPALSSTKSFTGHTLGACGGIEAVFSVMSLERQCIFPSLRFQSPMAELNIVPQRKFEFGKLDHVMSNSFGFGGNCSSIIFSKTDNR